MSIRTPRFVVIAALFLSPLQLLADDVVPAEERALEPKAVVEAFHLALHDGKRARVLEMLSPNVVIYEGGGTQRSRAEYASHHLESDLAFSAAIHRKKVDVHERVGDDIAWVITRSVLRGTFRKKKLHLEQTETIVLEKSEGKWVIVHAHWSSRSAHKGGH